MSDEVGQCPRCGATVVWSRTAAGKRIPLSPGFEQRALILYDGVVQLVAVRRCHFDTCPKTKEKNQHDQRPAKTASAR